MFISRMFLNRMTVRFFAVFFMSILIFGIWSCRHSRETVHPTQDIHVQLFENARVDSLDKERKLVELIIPDTGMGILFEAEDEFLNFLQERINWIVPVTFYCDGKPSKDCDLKKPYDLYVATRKVKPVIVSPKPSR